MFITYATSSDDELKHTQAEQKTATNLWELITNYENDFISHP
jgi:hypothetical protein